jgi:hypothetical protein
MAFDETKVQLFGIATIALLGVAIGLPAIQAAGVTGGWLIFGIVCAATVPLGLLVLGFWVFALIDWVRITRTRKRERALATATEQLTLAALQQAPVDGFQLLTVNSDGKSVLAVLKSTELVGPDYRAPLQVDFERLAQLGCSIVRLDLRALEFIDGAFCRILMGFVTELSAASGELTIDARPELADVLRSFKYYKWWVNVVT